MKIQTEAAAETALTENPIHIAEHEPTFVPIHPLLCKDFVPPQTFWEWMTEWNNARSAKSMIGLLSDGFNVRLQGESRFENYIYVEDPSFTWQERVVFYLRVANGWDNHHELSLPGEDSRLEYRWGTDPEDRAINKPLHSMRGMVACKALDMLNAHFFNEPLKDDRHRLRHFWLDVVRDPILTELQRFFEVREYATHIDVTNLPLHPSEPGKHKQMVGFILNLNRFIWEWGSWSSPRDWDEDDQGEEKAREFRAKLDSLKPWMIDLLQDLGMLNELMEWLRDLDQPTLAELEKIALKSELRTSSDPISKDRKVSTLDEARYAGSVAAWLIAKHELAVREYNRLKEIREMENQSRELEKKLKQLQPSVK